LPDLFTYPVLLCSIDLAAYDRNQYPGDHHHGTEKWTAFDLHKTLSQHLNPLVDP
jgi:hypothetical protein